MTYTTNEMQVTSNQQPATGNPPIDGFRLSPLQRYLWRQQQRQSLPFRAQALIQIEGKLNLQILKAAWRDVVEQHEILRTTFRHLPNEAWPVQVIGDFVAESAPDDDWRHEPEEVQNAKIAARFQDAKAAPFDFENGPLLHVAHATLSPGQHLLLVALPALCADAVSLTNFTRELSRSYRAHLLSDERSRTVERSRTAGVMQYADIAEWQNDLLDAEEGEAGRRFWRQQNIQPPLHLQLPFEAPRPGEADFNPLVFAVEMPAAISAQMAALAHEHKTSISTFLLACFNILLWRLTSEAEIVVGVSSHGRKFDELKEALGLFAKYLPARCSLQAQSRFVDLLAPLFATTEAIDTWQDFFNWEKLNGKLPEDAPPFLPFCFDFAAPAEKFSAGEVTFSILQQYVCSDRFKIKLVCVEHENALRLEFHYDASAYEAEDVQRFAAQFQALAASALERPHAAIRELNILPAAERQRLLVDFNDTAAAYPKDQCIHHVIAEQARLTPDSVAVIFNEQALTYGELHGRANQLAHRLRAMGVGPDVLVGICVERSLEMIIGMLAILKAGGAYLPLDPAYPPERLRLMLEDTQAPVLLTKESTIENFQLKIENLKLQILHLDTGWDAIARASRENPAAEVIPENLVYVIYTSGSTGKPKGVVISHQDLIISNRARIAYFQEPVHKFLLLSSLSFDSSVVGIFWTLCEGGALFLVPEDLQQNVPELAEIIEKNQISHLLTLPSFYALILEYTQPQQLQCLRTAIVAGEACPKKMVERHQERLKSTALFSEYGATETTVFSSVYDCLKQTLSFAPLGDPIANAQMYVLDAWQQPQPVGVPGEVYFGGDALSKGYLHRPDLTAERFIPNPFSPKPGDRLYKSGDLARHLPNGDIEFLGRIDNQVKIRGFRIELEEIEAALAQHPAVREVAVEARSERSRGALDDSASLSTSKRLVAYIAAATNSSVSISDWRHFLSERLPDYMVPSAFVVMESLPKNPNGKIDRRALPDPGPERPELEENFVAARTAIEKKLAEIWAEILRLEKVGIHDNFFELGGDSILSIQIISKARQAGLQIKPVQIFQHQTIAELAQAAGATTPAGGQAAINAEQGLVTGELPLTPIQHWFFEKNLPEPNHWNVSLLLEMRGDVSNVHLQQAAQQLLRHHDALRIRYKKEGVMSQPQGESRSAVYQTADKMSALPPIAESGWRQAVSGDEQAVPLDDVDLSALNDAAQMTVIEEKTAAFQAQLNLALGPLMRFVRFERGAGKNPYLLWVLHHLVCDIVSWRLMIEDLQTALAQLRRGEEIQLPAKTTSFKHWAERLTVYAQSEAVKRELDYWLGAVPAQPPALPLDYGNGLDANTEASTRTVKVFLSAEETRALLQEVPKFYNSQINEVLLAAFALAFGQWTGESSVLFELEGHGREDIFSDGSTEPSARASGRGLAEVVDLSRTVGWFTIFYPVCLKLNASADAGEAVSAVKEQLRRIPNRGFGYSLLRYLHADPQILAKLRRLPQAQINFNYLGQFDQALQESAGFALVQETNIHDRHPAGPRSHVLEIVGIVVRGCLQMEWSYSENLHRAETIENLAKNFMKNLRAIIEHSRAGEAKAFTAADFADFDWAQSEVDGIAAAILKSTEE